MLYYKLEPLVLQDKIVYNQIVGRTILHCDLNNFYASVEQKLHPEYDGMPLAVCGDPEARHGIVLAKNQLELNQPSRLTPIILLTVLQVIVFPKHRFIVTNLQNLSF